MRFTWMAGWANMARDNPRADAKSVTMVLDSIDSLQQGLDRQGYVSDRALATVVYLAHALQKPLLLEGEPGVGKTELAVVLARLLDTELIRLQCYEGLDAPAALYEWNYPKQLLTIRMMESTARGAAEPAPEIFSREFLIERPLLAAIGGAGSKPPVLLIDELDRADEEFEAFLLEFLGDFQISIPEVGTIKAVQPPLVVLTSNRTRDVHDALKRRCLYHWIDLPEFDKELAIVRARVPEAGESLARQVTAFMGRIRDGDLLKRPGVSETLDWARALLVMGATGLDPETVDSTLGCIFKYQEDLQRFKEQEFNSAEAKAAFIAACAGVELD